MVSGLLPKTIPGSCRPRLFSRPIFLFLASSSNIQSFLRKIEGAVSGFSGPPQHHVPPSQPQPLPRDLLTAEFVFVREDASKPPLSPLYRGPYKVLERFEKFFILKIGDKSDSVSVDRLKAVYSSVPVTPAVPPPQGRPRLQPASVTEPPAPVHAKKKVRFKVPVPATKLRRNPHQTVQGILPSSTVLRPLLLGGVSVAAQNTTTAFSASCLQSLSWNPPRHLSQPYEPS